MKCVLHIGTEKTATTTLQNWLYSNQQALSANGIFLSNQLERGKNRRFTAFFQKQLDDWAEQNHILTQADKDRFFRNFLPGLVSEITYAKQNHDVFIITSEHLHSRIRTREEAEAIRNFLKSQFSQTEIVCYFRPQSEVAVSHYSTTVKMNACEKLNDYTDKVDSNNYYYNYKKIADLWSSVFGKECCKFRIFNRETFIDGDIRKDFIKIIDKNLPTHKLDFQVDHENKSLHALQGAAFRGVNSVIPYWKENKAGINPENLRIKQALSNLDALNYGKIYSEQSAEILERFKSVNEAFFREYFGTENQFLPTEAPPRAKAELPIHQAEDVVEQLTSTLLQLQRKEIGDGEINVLRDIALKIAGHATLTLSDALVLMVIAHNARPDGMFIRQKIVEWCNILQANKKHKKTETPAQ